MWDFEIAEHVLAIAGFAAVARKSGRQRKLRMQCSTNYLLSAAKVGARCVSHRHVESDDAGSRTEEDPASIKGRVINNLEVALNKAS